MNNETFKNEHKEKGSKYVLECWEIIIMQANSFNVSKWDDCFVLLSILFASNGRLLSCIEEHTLFLTDTILFGKDCNCDIIKPIIANDVS